MTFAAGHAQSLRVLRHVHPAVGREERVAGKCYASGREHRISSSQLLIMHRADKSANCASSNCYHVSHFGPAVRRCKAAQAEGPIGSIPLRLSSLFKSCPLILPRWLTGRRIPVYSLTYSKVVVYGHLHPCDFRPLS